MAQLGRVFRSNAAIRASLSRSRLLRANGVPTPLKLALLGLTRRGGIPLRLERLRRKLPKQLTGVGAKRFLRPLVL